MGNVYFDLTREFNASEAIVALASGQATVHYRIAIMSKDGDWIIRETGAACRGVREVLDRHGARYRPGAPLDPRWLGGGWSSHLQFLDPRGRRVRCDFFSRPPRIDGASVERLFREASEPMLVVGLEPLIRMKRTQRAKDYAVIAELARLLPPEREIELTTDAERVIQLARVAGAASSRSCVRSARAGLGVEQVEVELVREMRLQREEDRRRVQRYARAAESYLAAFLAAALDRRPLAEAHETACELAERCLPPEPPLSPPADPPSAPPAEASLLPRGGPDAGPQ